MFAYDNYYNIISVDSLKDEVKVFIEKYCLKELQNKSIETFKQIFGLKFYQNVCINLDDYCEEGYGE